MLFYAYRISIDFLDQQNKHKDIFFNLQQGYRLADIFIYNEKGQCYVWQLTRKNKDAKLIIVH